jgi:prepilin peptidase CpaA
MPVIYLTLYSFGTICALALGAAGAWTDIRGMKIPNIFSLLIAIAFFAAFIAARQAGITVFGTLQDHIVAALIVFGVTFALYVTNTLGAGDSKLVSAFALWMGLPHLLPFLLYTALYGGVLGFVALAIARRKPFAAPPAGSWIDRLQDGERVVPYGIAIFLGALTMFMILGYHTPEMFTALDAQDLSR